jgi:hypothetical protein
MRDRDEKIHMLGEGITDSPIIMLEMTATWNFTVPLVFDTTAFRRLHPATPL